MKSPSAETWRHAIKEAHDGNPYLLLELLLQPMRTDSRGEPLPGAFFDLPDDRALRYDIVRVLMLGPWKGATTIQELMTHSNWGKGKPRASDREISFIAAMRDLGAGRDVIDGAADALGIERETLRKRIGEQRRTKQKK